MPEPSGAPPLIDTIGALLVKDGSVHRLHDSDGGEDVLLFDLTGYTDTGYEEGSGSVVATGSRLVLTLSVARLLAAAVLNATELNRCTCYGRQTRQEEFHAHES
jgi:hypothetical protein